MENYFANKPLGRPRETGAKYNSILTDIENKKVSGVILGTLTSIKKKYDISSYSNVYRVIDKLTARGIITKEHSIYKYR